MKPERILSLVGYDPALLHSLSQENRNALRGAAVVWLVACVVLGLSAGYAATLIQPQLWGSVLGGIAVAVLMVNLLRVVNAGGGSPLRATRRASEAAARSYRPSAVPAVVFGVLAAILAQPGQLAFWPEIDAQVDEHRQALIAQHEVAAKNLGTDADYYRDELEAAGFPIFRIKLMWKDPRRALRYTAILFLLVLLPSFWSQVISIKGHRAYELERTRRSHDAKLALRKAGRQEAATLLKQWSSYDPPSPWMGRGTKAGRRGPWLRRSPS